MAFQVPVINSPLTITGIVLVTAVIAIILILILLKLYQVKSAARSKPSAGRLQEKAGVPIVSREPRIPLHEPDRTGPEPGHVMDLSDQGDISKNMQVFAEKYQLDSFTLSSEDGLVIASTSADGQSDAANYSQSFKAGLESPEPGTIIFGMTHRGSTIIGIIKSGHPIPIPVPGDIQTDATNILRWSL